MAQTMCRSAPTLNSGNPLTVGYAPGPQGANPYSQTFLMGLKNYTIDLSIFKVVSITERMKLRFNVDAFNALNMMGCQPQRHRWNRSS